MTSNPFEDESVQNHPFIQELKQALGDEGERFWYDKTNDKFVSMEALRADGNPVTVVLAQGQWHSMFWNVEHN